MNGKLPGGSPNPLGNEAYNNNFTGNNWVAGDGNNHGVRIIALDVASVPVPPALWLFGSGVIALLGVAQRKRG